VGYGFLPSRSEKNGLHRVAERKSKFIMIVLILAAVLLTIAPESFRAVWQNREFGGSQVGVFL